LFTEKLHISLPEDRPFAVSVLDLQERVDYGPVQGTGQLEINLSSLALGCYLARVEAEFITTTRRILKTF
jgi:hypothetical protein